MNYLLYLLGESKIGHGVMFPVDKIFEKHDVNQSCVL